MLRELKIIVTTMFILVLSPAQIHAQFVKITPLGSHDGEFCQNDRAMLFEDPTGVRILYDADKLSPARQTRGLATCM